jgi:5-methylcytosine-specific restriction endonuclease McrA
MPWSDSPEKRQRDREKYDHPEYRRNRRLALRRANGHCEKCGRTKARLEVDHRVALANGGDHSIGNLWVLCSGPGGCHTIKSAIEGGIARQTRNSDPPSTSPRLWP